MCGDMGIDMCVDMCIGMCVGMCGDMGIDMCEDMCVDGRTDMRMDMCADMCRQSVIACVSRSTRPRRPLSAEMTGHQGIYLRLHPMRTSGGG